MKGTDTVHGETNCWKKCPREIKKALFDRFKVFVGEQKCFHASERYELVEPRQRSAELKAFSKQRPNSKRDSRGEERGAVLRLNELGMGCMEEPKITGPIQKDLSSMPFMNRDPHLLFTPSACHAERGNKNTGAWLGCWPAGMALQTANKCTNASSAKSPSSAPFPPFHENE